MEEGRSSSNISSGKTTRKRPSGRPRRRCQDNTRLNIKEIDVNTRNWVDLAKVSDNWRGLVNAALKFGIHNSWS